ncbi:unnamed protein product, partial [Phaeothamnion confervicola]
MGDVADILGLRAPGATSASNSGRVSPLGIGAPTHKKRRGGKGAKPSGMSREVYALLGKEGAPPLRKFTPLLLPSSPVVTPWDRLWAPFSNSARTDGTQLEHWVKAGVEYTEYPYARYNVKLDKIEYSDAEYERLLQDPEWSREDTDQLMALCWRYDLRWPVVHDRYTAVPSRGVEQLQHRFYTVARRLQHSRAAAAAAGSGGMVAAGLLGAEMVGAAPGLEVFSLEYEQQRRKQLEKLFRKTTAKEEEEQQLRDEIKQMDVRIKKLQKAAGSNKAAEEVAAMADARKLALASHVPSRGQPYLQSRRLVKEGHAPVQGLGKNLVKKVNLMLAELDVPEVLAAPTKTVCDMHDELRREVVTLLTLQKILAKK